METVVKKEIKDYLHLYVGCEIISDWGVRFRLCTVTNSEYNPYADCKGTRIDSPKVMVDLFAKDIKLILRPLDEACSNSELMAKIAAEVGVNGKTIIDLTYGLSEYISIPMAAIILNKLRKEGYDCDDLIPSNLAIDSTTK